MDGHGSALWEGLRVLPCPRKTLWRYTHTINVSNWKVSMFKFYVSFKHICPNRNVRTDSRIETYHRSPIVLSRNDPVRRDTSMETGLDEAARPSRHPGDAPGSHSAEGDQRERGHVEDPWGVLSQQSCKQCMSRSTPCASWPKHTCDDESRAWNLLDSSQCCHGWKRNITSLAPFVNPQCSCDTGHMEMYLWLVYRRLLFWTFCLRVFYIPPRGHLNAFFTGAFL